ncbi:MAG TPA: hypothetical protein VHL31_12235 [Geminicoccus sp.]|jgi:hypothetical protein|uniref:hypothetical protein n=1 Tax=Geminicoccus sp. TaxID=2024832 RepID=UPI002E368441|nr:hypothetical protein [Geminicoccus sp.]HEX2527049.1 hypothetical protein [Geminicoccus sp.]
MLARTWHGWTSPAKADAYENLLRREVFPAIAARTGQGLTRIDLLRRPDGEEVEFMTIMWFADQAALDRFTHGNGEAAYVPAAARAVLQHFDDRSRHYELRHRQE